MATFGVIHEAVMGCTNKILILNLTFTPLSEGASMGIHESQSLFNEIIIGSNRAFGKNNTRFSKNAQKVLLMILF